MLNDLISVIIPVYNVEKYLSQCVESVIEQTYQNLEIILIDDGSTDNSGTICDKYLKFDKRIKVIHKDNGGVSSSRNKGMDACSPGGYYLFVDSDDWLEKTMVEKLYKKAIETNADIVDCGYKLAYYNKNINVCRNNEIIYKNNVLEKAYLDDYITCIVWKKLYKKEVFTNVKFPIGKNHEDIFIFLATLQNCKIIVSLPNSLYYYRQRRSSIVNSQFNTKSLDAVSAFEHDLIFAKQNNIISIINQAEKALVYCQKDKIDKILLGNNKTQYINIAKKLQKNIRKNLFKILLSDSYSIKQKIYFPILAYSLKLYELALKIKIKTNNKKNIYFE